MPACLFGLPAALMPAPWSRRQPCRVSCVPQWAVPLPVFGPAGPIPRVNAAQFPNLTVTMKEIDQVVLPQGTFPCPHLRRRRHGHIRADQGLGLRDQKHAQWSAPWPCELARGHDRRQEVQTNAGEIRQHSADLQPRKPHRPRPGPGADLQLTRLSTGLTRSGAAGALGCMMYPPASPAGRSLHDSLCRYCPCDCPSARR